MPDRNFVSSAAADKASAYFNALPFEQRKELAPLLEDHRQRGFAEALNYLAAAQHRIQDRIRGIQNA